MKTSLLVALGALWVLPAAALERPDLKRRDDSDANW